MASAIKMFSNIPKTRHFSSVKRNFTVGKIIYKKSSAPSASAPNVQGVSERVVKISNEPVGPGAAKNTNYKNPEYFCYDNTSYYEAELEMLKFRCPQPSVHKPYQHPNPK